MVWIHTYPELSQTIISRKHSLYMCTAEMSLSFRCTFVDTKLVYLLGREREGQGRNNLSLLYAFINHGWFQWRIRGPLCLPVRDSDFFEAVSPLTGFTMWLLPVRQPLHPCSPLLAIAVPRDIPSALSSSLLTGWRQAESCPFGGWLSAKTVYTLAKRFPSVGNLVPKIVLFIFWDKS